MKLPDKPYWLRNAVRRDVAQELRSLCLAAKRPGTRIELTSDLALLLAQNLPLHLIASEAIITRIVGFDKKQGQNWTLPWHQDRVIAVADQQEVPGYKNWSCKARVWHCEPPEHVLEMMLFTRLLLEDIGPDQGGMEFAAGSHCAGLVPSDQADDQAKRYPKELETGKAGDLLVMPMLTLHRSGKTHSAKSRAVLRIDLATQALPAPLQWLSLRNE